MLTIHFIRHAQSTSNIKPDIVGGQQLNIELTETGRKQARKLQQLLQQKAIQPHHIICSTATRARETAKIATSHLDTEIVFDKRIVEMSRGEWEGKPKSEVYVGEYKKLREQESLDLKAPGGEDIHEVIERNKKALEDIEKLFEPGVNKHVFWFGHGRAIKSLIGELLGNKELAYKSAKHNTARSVFVYDGKHYRMHHFNDVRHLHI